MWNIVLIIRKAERRELYAECGFLKAENESLSCDKYSEFEKRILNVEEEMSCFEIKIPELVKILNVEKEKESYASGEP